jgi:hypothetical protein
VTNLFTFVLLGNLKDQANNELLVKSFTNPNKVKSKDEFDPS